jgi:hypothetical protein
MAGRDSDEMRHGSSNLTYACGCTLGIVEPLEGSGLVGLKRCIVTSHALQPAKNRSCRERTQSVGMIARSD